MILSLTCTAVLQVPRSQLVWTAKTPSQGGMNPSMPGQPGQPGHVHPAYPAASMPHPPGMVPAAGGHPHPLAAYVVPGSYPPVGTAAAAGYSGTGPGASTMMVPAGHAGFPGLAGAPASSAWPAATPEGALSEGLEAISDSNAAKRRRRGAKDAKAGASKKGPCIIYSPTWGGVVAGARDSAVLWRI